jgi:hypothetical protein
MEKLIIFFIEERAIKLNIISHLINLIAEQGFYILQQESLRFQEIEIIKSFNIWEDILAKESAILVVALDFLPISPNALQKQNHPTLDNLRVLTREKINSYCQELYSFLDYNLLRSGDNSQQSWELLKLLFPEKISPIKAQIKQLSQSFITHYPVKRNLTSGWKRRSKVELIDYQGNLAVKKTFKPGCERFFRRELFVYQKLSQMRSEIPLLLGYGQSFVIVPYYEDIFCFRHDSQQQIPLEIVKQAMKFLHFFYQLGYALIDFYPGNFIVDKEEGLKAIDFEFLYPYPSKPNSFINCYDLEGTPRNFDGDKPISLLEKKEMYVFRSYEKYWKPYINLELDLVIQDII